MADKRRRSRSYPGYTLEECIRWATIVRSDLGSGPHDRHSIAKALGSTGLTGASTRKIGAMVHFGLMKRDSEGYSLSGLSERILRPVDASERSDSVAEAFIHPDLYAELLKRFEPDGHIPSRIANILIRDHGIEDTVAEDAARVFLASGRFAGILDENARITSRATFDVPAAVPEEADFAPDTDVMTSSPVILSGTVSPSTAGIQSFKFALTRNRTASLTVPFELSANDVLLIQKQIELLSLQVRIGESNAE